MLVVHQGLGNLHLVCNECGKKFYKYRVKSEKITVKGEFEKHMRIHEVVNFTCDCMGVVKIRQGEEFVLNSTRLSNHYFSKEKHIRVNHEGWIGCNVCNKYFKTKEEKVRHEKRHENVRTCTLCEFVSKSYANLGWHNMTEHRKKPTPCSICEIIFPDIKSLRSHKRLDHEPKMTCDYCGEMFRNLTNHIRKNHTKETDKKYQCSECGKGFIHEYMIKNHTQSVHTQNPLHQCRYGCDNRYKDRVNMLAHERKRHGGQFEYLKKVK